MRGRRISSKRVVTGIYIVKAQAGTKGGSRIKSTSKANACGQVAMLFALLW